MRPRPFTIAVLVGAFVGLLFAAVSTYDFARHVDRQVHDLHCSFVPGLSGTEAESGCQVTMLSSYSSVWRTWVWGGVPISLPAMSVFAFLLFFAVELVVTRRQDDRRAAGFLALATALPALASLVMAIVSLTRLEALCKLCAGIYGASALCLVGGVGLWMQARRGQPAAALPARPPKATTDDHHRADPAFAGGPRAPTEPPPERIERAASRPPVGWGYLAASFGIGVLFVLFPVFGYVAAMPDHGRFIGTCGTLEQADGDETVLVPLGDQAGIPVIEVLDPLCPTCRAFEERLGTSGLEGDLARKVVLFPLDKPCNWMIDDAVHPGACEVSSAVLCAGDRAADVLDWAFAEQEAIMAAEKATEGAAGKLVVERFPDLAACIGSSPTKARLNDSMHWVANRSLPVMTPQVYVDGVKLCDEDIDLGLDFALSKMIEAHRAGRLRLPAEAPVAGEAAGEAAAKPAPGSPEPSPAPTSETAPEPAADTEPAPAADTEPEPGADTEPEPAADTEPASEPAADTNTDTEPAADTEPEPAADTEPEPEPEPAVAPDPAPADDQGGTP